MTNTLIERLDAIELEAKNIRIQLTKKSGVVTDRVKTVEDAFFEVGRDYKSFQAWCESNHDSKDEVAYKELKVIAAALNEGWTPDWSDGNERKYYPWFTYSAKESGLVYDSANDWYSSTDVGSRLCFKNAELAEYAGKQFSAVYKVFLEKD
jgi:hypothetical protein